MGAKQLQSSNLAPVQFFKMKLEGMAIHRHCSKLILLFEVYTSVTRHSQGSFLSAFKIYFNEIYLFKTRRKKRSLESLLQLN